MGSSGGRYVSQNKEPSLYIVMDAFFFNFFYFFVYVFFFLIFLLCVACFYVIGGVRMGQAR